MNRDQKIILQIIAQKQKMIEETGKVPDLVFIHPDLLSQEHDSIDEMKVHCSPYIEKTRAVLSVKRELEPNPFAENKPQFPIKPVWAEPGFLRYTP